MGLNDLLSHLVGAVRPSDENPGPEVDQATRDLAADAASDDLAPDDLVACGVHTDRPILDHLDDGEQPEYVFRGGELLVTDAEGDLSRNHPSGEMRIVVTDRRVLFIQGGRISDTVIEVPLTDVVSVYRDDEEMRKYLIVETHHDSEDDLRETDRTGLRSNSLLGGGEPEEWQTTFFGDVTLESNAEAVTEGIRYIRAHAPEITDV